MGESDPISITMDRCLKAYENAQQSFNVLSNAVDESEENALAKWTKAYQKVLSDHRAAPKNVRAFWKNLDSVQQAGIKELEAAVVDTISEKHSMPRELANLEQSLARKIDELPNAETTAGKLQRRLEVK